MNTRRHIAIVLSILYVCFWASTHLFYHAHYLPNGVITHSHPYFPSDNNQPEHSHTAAQFQFLDILETALFVGSELLFIFGIVACLCIVLLLVTESRSTSSYYVFSSLRAPPSASRFF